MYTVIRHSQGEVEILTDNKYDFLEEIDEEITVDVKKVSVESQIADLVIITDGLNKTEVSVIDAFFHFSFSFSLINGINIR